MWFFNSLQLNLKINTQIILKQIIAMPIKRRILSLLYIVLCAGAIFAQDIRKDTLTSLKHDSLLSAWQDTLYFEFKPKRKMFWSDYKKNHHFLKAMAKSLQLHKPQIDAGKLKIRVLGFTSSYPTEKQNRWVAKNRSNQVKSYFILKNGLNENHFFTSNFLHRWRGMSDVVAVTYWPLTLPETESDTLTDNQDSFIPSDSLCNPQPELPPTTETKTEPLSTETSTDSPSEPLLIEEDYYHWSVKTNIAYLAATVANLGIEYSFGAHYSIDIPLIYSPYTVARSYRLRFLAIQPEFRYWLKRPTQGHFFGAHLNIGAFNVAVDKQKRYQSPDGFYGAGLSYGYTLPFARHWAAEFTLGAGYIYTQYDTYYNIPNGARFEKGKNYHYWGLTKVGINLVYRFNL